MAKSEWGSVYIGSQNAKEIALSYFGALADGYSPLAVETLDDFETDRTKKMRMWAEKDGSIREFVRTFGRTFSIGCKVPGAASLKRLEGIR